MSSASRSPWRPAPAMSSTRGASTARPSSTRIRRTGPDAWTCSFAPCGWQRTSAPTPCTASAGHPGRHGRGHRLETPRRGTCPRAGRRTRAGVPLAVEPEPATCSPPSPTSTPPPILGDPAALGLTLDIGHCQCLEPLSPPTAYAPPALGCAMSRSRTCGAASTKHLPFGDGEIDFPPVLEALAATGYRALTVVELPRHSHAGPPLRRTVPSHSSTARPGRSPTAAKGESVNTPHPSRHAPASETPPPAVAELHARLNTHLGGAARAWLGQALDEAAAHPAPTAPSPSGSYG